jgi:hypothetical protein
MGREQQREYNRTMILISSEIEAVKKNIRNILNVLLHGNSLARRDVEFLLKRFYIYKKRLLILAKRYKINKDRDSTLRFIWFHDFYFNLESRKIRKIAINQAGLNFYPGNNKGFNYKKPVSSFRHLFEKNRYNPAEKLEKSVTEHQILAERIKEIEELGC